MKAQGVVELLHDVGRDLSEDGAQPFDGDRTNLLPLGLRVLA